MSCKLSPLDGGSLNEMSKPVLADPSVHWAHMSEGSFSHNTTHLTFLFQIKKKSINISFTVFALITAHAPISAQSSNFVGFRLQPQ